MREEHQSSQLKGHFLHINTPSPHNSSADRGLATIIKVRTCGEFVEKVDQLAELRLIAAIRTSVRELGGAPSTVAVNELLDERRGILALEPTH